MLYFDSQPERKIITQTVLQRLAQADRTAIQDCLETYGALVWALARSGGASTEEAERLASEIFSDVWKHAARFDPARCSESAFISLLARRRLIRH